MLQSWFKKLCLRCSWVLGCPCVALLAGEITRQWGNLQNYYQLNRKQRCNLPAEKEGLDAKRSKKKQTKPKPIKKPKQQ